MKKKTITYAKYDKLMNNAIKKNSKKGKQVHETLIDLLEICSKYQLKGLK